MFRYFQNSSFHLDLKKMIDTELLDLTKDKELMLLESIQDQQNLMALLQARHDHPERYNEPTPKYPLTLSKKIFKKQQRVKPERVMTLWNRYPLQKLLEDYVEDNMQLNSIVEPGVIVNDANDVDLEQEEQQTLQPVADLQKITPSNSKTNQQLSEEKLRLFQFNLFVVFQKLIGGERC